MSPKLFKYENELNLSIYMPNDIFKNIREWTLSGAVKSKQHQEFIYSYYWLIAFLWRYARYTQVEVSQPTIKEWLGYNPNEKRINYLIKKNGILDKVGLTESARNYPVDWKIEDKYLSFSMINEYSEEDQRMLNQFGSINYVVKSPLRHNTADGLFWTADNSHELNAYVFYTCMKNENLRCAGFYLYGYLKYLCDKSIYFNQSDKAEVTRETISEALQWDKKKISNLVNELQKEKLIEVERDVRKNGMWNRNGYKIINYNFDSQMEL